MFKFEINESDIPVLPQRCALMVIDLQKGLIDADGVCSTGNLAKLIQNVEALVPAFRKTGSIIWVNSQYEKFRPVNSSNPASEKIITNKHVNAVASASYRLVDNSGVLNMGNRHLESKAIPKAVDELDDPFGADDSCADADDDLFGGADEVIDDVGDTDEAFLSVQPGSKSAQRARNDKPALLEPLQTLRKPNDIYFTKSHYSAFKSGALLQTLRMNLITQIFICGALSNTSVYATAVEAASYGMMITLVDDCLGWRGKRRHEFALRELNEEYGCDKLTSEKIIADIQEKRARATANRQPGRPQRNQDLGAMLEMMKNRPVRHQENEDLPAMLGMLKLQGEAKTRPNSDANDIQGELKASSLGPPTAITNFGEDDESLVPLPRPIHPAQVAGKARVKSKIRQRRDLEKDIKTPSRIESKTSKKTILTPPTPHEETSEEMPPEDQNLAKTAKDQHSQNDTTTGKNDPPSTNVAAKRDRPRQEDFPTPSRNSNIFLISTTESPAKMSCSVEGEPICEGDTVVITDLLPSEDVDCIFEKLKTEIQWQRMSHQGGEVPRLVAVQGEIGKDGEIPVYRHPADEAPPLLAFSPTVTTIRRYVEKATGHAVNHCLIQYYRDGKDYISEHSDKTLDIVPSTFIANVSLGAERMMVFRGKRDSKDSDSVSSAVAPRKTARATLPHNSMMRMGLKTNMHWMHSIRQDKRREAEKTAAELDFGGGRISLTFRLIGTFLSKDQSKIWGQGAVVKDKASARSIVNGPTEEAAKMIQAFSLENRSSEFDRQEVYGKGFDVLHMSNTRRVLLSGNKVIDDGVRALLEHLGLDWSPSSITVPVNAKSGSGEPMVKLVDTDISRTTVQGHAAVLLYLDAVHWKRDSARTPFEYAKLYTRLHMVMSLASTDLGPKGLDLWEAFAAEDVHIAGAEVSIVDFAFFPILHSFKESSAKDGLRALEAYYKRMKEVSAIKKLLSSSDSE